jgi:hypothetical protein
VQEHGAELAGADDGNAHRAPFGGAAQQEAVEVQGGSRESF